ncbi:MAG: hypothetical protein H0Z32_03365 [Bacillaceae bacterium]|nr:hypothetical protein [Bacillaceae bacterium]
MEYFRIWKLSFGSYLLFSIIIHMSLGLVFGMLAFFISLLGGNVTFSFGYANFQGFVAGVLNLLFAPALTSLMGLFIGLITYLPFRWITGKTGIKFLGKFEEEETDL